MVIFLNTGLIKEDAYEIEVVPAYKYLSNVIG
jgi:hypothetical protein